MDDAPAGTGGVAPGFELPNVGPGPDPLSLDVIVDPGKAVAEAYEQPTRFGAHGRPHDLLGRMPERVTLDARDGEATVVATYEGDTPADRPAVETLLDDVAQLRETFVFDCELVAC